MTVSERRKGMRFEQRVARIFREAGLRVERLQQQQGLVCDFIVNDHLYVDTKKQERLQLPMWLRQARSQAPTGTSPVVVFQQGGGEAYACLPLDDLVRLAQ